MRLDEMKREEEELIELMNSEASVGEPEGGTSTPTTEDVITEETVDPTSNANALGETTPTEVTTEQDKPEKSKRTNWKKRFTTYKASADNTIYELRQELATKMRYMVDLEKTIEDLKKAIPAVDKYKDVITQEDEDTIGPDAVGIMKKTVEAATSGLEKKLQEAEAKERARRIEEAGKAKSLADLSFRQRLEGLVENFDDIDVDPRFHKFLGETDDSGLPRKTFFAKGVQGGDFMRVAGYYKEFLSTLPKSREDILEKKIAPVGGGDAISNGTPDAPLTYTIQEYMDKSSIIERGSWRNTKERDKLYKDIKVLEQAFVEGRLT